MNEKLTVKICTGTLCYVMGGADLQLLSEYMPEELVDRVEIKGSTCLDICNQPNAPKAPFVMVGDKLISEASIGKVVEAIKEHFSKK